MAPRIRRIITALGLSALTLGIAPTHAAPPAAVPNSTAAPTATANKFSKQTASNATKNPHAPANRSARSVIAEDKHLIHVSGGHAIHSYQRGTIVGTVTGPTGGTVPDASVTLMPAGWHHRNRHVHPLFAARTNAGGTFQFRGIRARHYQLLAGKRNVGRSDRLVRVSAGLPVRVNVQLHGASTAKHHKHRRHK